MSNGRRRVATEPHPPCTGGSSPAAARAVGEECEHGGLRRCCDICQLAAERDHEKARAEAWKKAAETLECCLVTEHPYYLNGHKPSLLRAEGNSLIRAARALDGEGK